MAPKPVRFLGPSTSTQIKVKNSAAVRVPPSSALQAWSPALANQSSGGRTARCSALPKAASPGGAEVPGHSPGLHGTRGAENGAAHPPPAKVLPSDKKATPHRVIKLRRTPLCAPAPSQPASSAASSAARPRGTPALPEAREPALDVRTENLQGGTDWCPVCLQSFQPDWHAGVTLFVDVVEVKT